VRLTAGEASKIFKGNDEDKYHVDGWSFIGSHVVLEERRATSVKKKVSEYGTVRSRVSIESISQADLNRINKKRKSVSESPKKKKTVSELKKKRRASPDSTVTFNAKKNKRSASLNQKFVKGQT